MDLDGEATGEATGEISSAGNAEQNLVPPTADDVVEYARTNNGAAQPGYKGGANFENRDLRLPTNDASGNPITYKEYDTNPYMKGVNRGTERVVIGSDGTAYYTNDHYTTSYNRKSWMAGN